MSERDTMERAVEGSTAADGGRPAPTDADQPLSTADQPLSTADIARGGTPPPPAPENGALPSDQPASAAVATEEGQSTERRAEATASPAARQAVTASDDERRTPLFVEEKAGDLRARWESIQIGFVDEPRSAVEQADSLVAEAMQSLATAFSRQRSSLERQWSEGQDVSTEDLRQTLRRYRSFFDRLLSL